MTKNTLTSVSPTSTAQEIPIIIDSACLDNLSSIMKNNLVIFVVENEEQAGTQES